jgi:hypothetical protein
MPNFFDFFNRDKKVSAQRKYKNEESGNLQELRDRGIRKTGEQIGYACVIVLFLPVRALLILSNFNPEDFQKTRQIMLVSAAGGFIVWLCCFNGLPLLLFNEVYAVSIGINYYAYQKERHQRQMDEIFLKCGITDDLGFTPKLLAENEKEIVLSSPAIALEVYDKKREALGRALGCRITEIVPSTDAHEIIMLKVSKNLLKKFYPFDQNCVNFFRHQAPKESFLIGHDGDELLHEQLGQGILYHQLVAGSTRGGKSCFLRVGIISLLLSSVFNRKSSIQLYLVDFKNAIELGYLRNFSPTFVATTPEKAAAIFEFLHMELERRLVKYAQTQNGCVNIDEMRQKLGGDITQEPRMLCVIDEAGSLFESLERLWKNKQKQKSKKEEIGMSYEDMQISLCQRSAACGIGIVYAGQYPKADVIPSSLAVNLTNRVVFRLANAAASRAMISDDSASQIPPSCPGRLIYTGRGQIQTLQALYLTQQEAIAILNTLPKQPISDEFIRFLEESDTSERRAMAEELKKEKIKRQRLIAGQARRVVILNS